ncbi:proline/glycine betaine ABC transporter permease [Aquamicrobium sp. LC103]|uniref:ABC transporter permease n=1 Tax=Aquamicrobium sp. LC103 TaxID=1120658 RepID=UPI0009E509E7|nr:proline/glycine betaine ABC transporter permease [Aquamicrobium sp. LC103]TKT78298.1 proline/glycine betaine ABC transporter permease [Aquamicrobium sp. LC103]
MATEVFDQLRAAADAVRPSSYRILPLDDWIEAVVKDWFVPTLRPIFRALQWPIAQVLDGLQSVLLAIPFAVVVIIAVLAAWRAAGRGIAIITFVSLFLLDWIGLWRETMITLAMIVTAVAFCIVVGIPLGIAAARSNRTAAVFRPILDVMQTIPSFVYLVPIVMLFGVGMVPAVIATIVFALPPLVRLTNLGIRQVQGELVEAGRAFGSTPRQILWEIQLPLALRTIMTGVNQTLMLALSMTVIGALIGAGGLGLVVYTGLGRLDVGYASIGGLGIVLLAIILDRITQAMGDGDNARRRKAGRTAGERTPDAVAGEAA